MLPVHLIRQMLLMTCLKEIRLRALTSPGVLGILLVRLVDIDVLLPGQIAMACDRTVYWLSVLASQILALSLHLLNYPFHQLTGVLEPQELLRESHVIRSKALLLLT